MESNLKRDLDREVGQLKLSLTQLLTNFSDKTGLVVIGVYFEPKTITDKYEQELTVYEALEVSVSL